MSMQIDVGGRVKNLHLPRTQPYIPLFESLVNSIESVAEANGTDGRIDVAIEHDTTQSPIPGVEDSGVAIRSITISDNGLGFNDVNFLSFNLSDSTTKANQGNKGIGRFTWLKVFEEAHVESCYEDSGEWHQRIFDFKKSKNGVENEQVIETKSRTRKTKVELKNLHSEYQKHFPKTLETISRKIIDHLLIYFVSDSCPAIWLSDNLGSASINLVDLFRQELSGQVTRLPFKVRDKDFEARIVRIHSSATRQHSVSYCAHQREVRAQRASTLVPDLVAKLTDESGNPFVFLTYVSGEFLDENVNSERTDFVFLQNPSLDLGFDDDLGKDELDTAVAQQIQQAAAPYLDELRKEKRRDVEQFVANKAPEYRFILNEKYQRHLEKIPPRLKDEALDVALFKTQRQIEVEHREQAHAVQIAKKDTPVESVQYKKLYEEYLEQENELGKAALAKYVIHRRTILDLLDSALAIQDDGTFVKEELVHRLIYPMRSNSDEVPFAEQNLWVIDERLAFHSHLASDVPLKSVKPLTSIAPDEPDLVVFNTPSAFSESDSQFQSIVLIEFKRPERNEYPKNDEDPVEQVIRYVEKIKTGGAKTAKQKSFGPGLANTPFYAYILCSLTPRIQQIASNRDFTLMPDGQGYFQFHRNSGCYIEILSFDKVLNDAKKRNRSFFERLQIKAT